MRGFLVINSFKKNLKKKNVTVSFLFANKQTNKKLQRLRTVSETRLIHQHADSSVADNIIKLQQRRNKEQNKQKKEGPGCWGKKENLDSRIRSIVWIFTGSNNSLELKQLL